MQPEFLICVPTFNRAHLINQVYESAKTQSYTNWKLIFVDDASTDETQNVVSALAEQDNRVLYFKMSVNSGVNAVRNRLIEECQKLNEDAFMYFIDDDDLLAPNCFEAAAKAIQENPEQKWFALMCDFPSGEAISKVARFGHNSYLAEYMFGKGLRGDLTNIVKVSLVGDSRFTDQFRNAEIWYFWMQLSLKSTLFCVDALGSIKDYLPEGITQSGFNRDKAIEVQRFKIKHLEPIYGTKKLKHQYVTLAKHLINRGEFAQARACLSTVFDVAPFYFRQYRHWFKLLGK